MQLFLHLITKGNLASVNWRYNLSNHHFNWSRGCGSMSVSDLLPTYPSPNSTLTLTCNRLIELFPDLFLKQKFTILPSILAPQGVIKGRKRITLMVVAVSVTFAICWGTNQIDYAMMYVASCDIGKVPVAICNIMVLSNSAVNALVYLSL